MSNHNKTQVRIQPDKHHRIEEVDENQPNQLSEPTMGKDLKSTLKIHQNRSEAEVEELKKNF